MPVVLGCYLPGAMPFDSSLLFSRVRSEQDEKKIGWGAHSFRPIAFSDYFVRFRISFSLVLMPLSRQAFYKRKRSSERALFEVEVSKSLFI